MSLSSTTKIWSTLGSSSRAIGRVLPTKPSASSRLAEKSPAPLRTSPLRERPASAGAAAGTALGAVGAGAAPGVAKALTAGAGEEAAAAAGVNARTAGAATGAARTGAGADGADAAMGIKPEGGWVGAKPEAALGVALAGLRGFVGAAALAVGTLVACACGAVPFKSCSTVVSTFIRFRGRFWLDQPVPPSVAPINMTCWLGLLATAARSVAGSSALTTAKLASLASATSK